MQRTQTRYNTKNTLDNNDKLDWCFQFQVLTQNQSQMKNYHLSLYQISKKIPLKFVTRVS